MITTLLQCRDAYGYYTFYRNADEDVSVCSEAINTLVGPTRLHMRTIRASFALKNPKCKGWRRATLRTYDIEVKQGGLFFNTHNRLRRFLSRHGVKVNVPFWFNIVEVKQ